MYPIRRIQLLLRVLPTDCAVPPPLFIWRLQPQLSQHLPQGAFLDYHWPGQDPLLSPSFHGRPLPSRPRPHWVEILGYVLPGRVGMKQTPLLGTPPHHFSVPRDP